MRKIVSTQQKALNAEYAKQRRRVNQIIRRAEKQGYVSRETLIPAKPKKITQRDINKLANITPEKLRKKSQLVDLTTGEIKRKTKKNISQVTKQNRAYQKEVKKLADDNKKLIEIEKQVMAREVQQVDEMRIAELEYMNFTHTFISIPEKVRIKLLERIEQMRDQYGVVVLMGAVKQLPFEFIDILQKVGYDSLQAVDEYCSLLMIYMKELMSLSDDEVQEYEDEYDYNTMNEWTEWDGDFNEI